MLLQAIPGNSCWAPQAQGSTVDVIVISPTAQSTWAVRAVLPSRQGAVSSSALPSCWGGVRQTHAARYALDAGEALQQQQLEKRHVQSLSVTAAAHCNPRQQLPIPDGWVSTAAASHQGATLSVRAAWNAQQPGELATVLTANLAPCSSCFRHQLGSTLMRHLAADHGMHREAAGAGVIANRAC